MKQLDQNTLPETTNPQGGQADITDNTNIQLIKILPIRLEEGELIGKEFPGIKGFVSQIIGKKKVGTNELIYVRTSENEDFYLYPDGNPVYIKNTDGTNTEYLVSFDSKFINFKGREITDGSQPFFIDNFQVVGIVNDIGRKAIIYRFSEEDLGESKCLTIGTANGKETRSYVVDQETGSIMRVGGKSIEYIDKDQKIKIKDTILQRVHLNKGGKVWIYTDTLQEVKIEGIEENIREISLGNYNMHDTYLGPYQVMFAVTDKGNTYIFDINTMKVLKIPELDFAIDAKKLIDKRFDSDSYSSEIKGNEFNIFHKEIFSVPLHIPYLKENNLPKNISIYKESGLPVKVPSTELFVCGFDQTYTPDRAKIINCHRYGKAVILDTEEGINYGIYLREGDLSILEATLANGEKVMINKLLDEDIRTLHIDGKEIITVKYNKYRDSTIINKQTFEEVLVKIPGTDEEINLIRHHVLTIGGQDIIQVDTKSGKNIYVYKKTLAPLQIAGVTGYVEDIKELEDGKRNMKIDGKWNVVRVK